MSWHDRKPGVLAAVLGVALSVVGCSDFFVSVIQSPIPPYETVVDEFRQTALPTRDILWLIDSTLSMSNELATLAPLFDSFIGELNSYDISYQVGITTSDADREKGALVGKIPIITRNTENAAAVFNDNLSEIINNLTSLSQETGLRAMELALSESNLCPGCANFGFLREGAGITVIVVSDSDDKSSGEVSYFASLLQTIAGGEDGAHVMFHGIVGPDTGCLGAVPGTRYTQMASALNGATSSICSPDLEAVLTSLGKSQIQPQRIFQLSREPVEGGTLLVTVDGEIVHEWEDWVYDPLKGELSFPEGSEPAYGALIRVVYQSAEESL